MQCVVLAGGIGTRMRPLTEKIPKALIEAAGRPFVDHQLSWLASHGVDEVVLCIGHKGELLRRFVGGGERWKLRVTYADEGEDLKGTGGALRVALDAGRLAERFLVTYGDSFLPVDFGRVWAAFGTCGKPALMTVFRNDGRWDSSNVAYADGSVMLYDKFHRMGSKESFHFIDYGLSALARTVVESRIPAGGPCDLADVFFDLSTAGQLAGFEVHERFYEVGSPSGLADFEAWLKEP